MQIETYIALLISALAVAGFSLALYIRSHKKEATPLVCPLNGKCEQVVHSKYSTLFGIPVEILGMIYYLIVAGTYLVSLMFPDLLHPYVNYVVLGITTAAFFFSLYLTALQAFVLKSWCTWCLFSAGICTLIFALVLFLSDISLTDLLSPLSSL